MFPYFYYNGAFISSLRCDCFFTCKKRTDQRLSIRLRNALFTIVLLQWSWMQLFTKMRKNRSSVIRGCVVKFWREPASSFLHDSYVRNFAHGDKAAWDVGRRGCRARDYKKFSRRVHSVNEKSGALPAEGWKLRRRFGSVENSQSFSRITYELTEKREIGRYQHFATSSREKLCTSVGIPWKKVSLVRLFLAP